MVGEDLDFDVARALDASLEKNRGVAEGLECFDAGAFKGVRQLVRRLHQSNAVTASARRGLDQQRETHTFGVR